MKQKLAGTPNKQIAKIIEIKSEATVRQHLTTAYQAFRLGDDKRSSWSDLQSLFFQFMPELIPAPPGEPQPLNYRWVERTSDITKLQKWTSEKFKILIIVGEGGIGKTTLAQQYLASCQFDKRLDIKSPTLQKTCGVPIHLCRLGCNKIFRKMHPEILT